MNTHPLQTLLSDAGYEVRAHEMHGKEYLSVTALSVGNLFADALEALGDRYVMDIAEAFRHIKFDDTLFYFPTVHMVKP
jgi:hypothetical protein